MQSQRYIDTPRSDGLINRTEKKIPQYWVAAVDRAGDVTLLKVDRHDAEREQTWVHEGFLLVEDYRSASASDPAIKLPRFGANGERVKDEHGKTVFETVHIKPELVALMDERKAKAEADREAARRAMPETREKYEQRDLVEKVGQKTADAIVAGLAALANKGGKKAQE